MTAGKLDGVLSRLKTGWATVADLQAETGWTSPHSVRGAVSQLRIKGHPIERKREGGVTSYRLPDDYKPRDDFAKSVDAAYDAIKERQADGGPGWEPK